MRPVLRLARPYLPRLVAAGLLAAGAELAGLALLATAVWLLVTAAGQPPLTALTVAIVSVRALAIARGGLRYVERLVGHDAVLRMLAEVRAKLFAALAVGAGAPAPCTDSADQDSAGHAAAPAGVTARSGDLLSRLVSDVEAVQDLLLRVLVPAAAAVGVGVLTIGAAAIVAPPAALVLAAGLLVAGVLLPAVAMRAVARHAARLAPLRGAVATDAVDLTHGAADLAAYGATPGAERQAGDRAARLAALEARLFTRGVLLDGVGTLVAGLTAAGVLIAALTADIGGATVAVLTIAALIAVESSLVLLGAARRWAEIHTPLRRVGDLLAARTGEPDDGVPVPDGPITVIAEDVHASYSPGGPPALAGVDLHLPPGRRVAVVGPSGAGKSTLLATLAGLHPVTGGSVSAAGRPLAAYRADQRHRLVGGLFADAHVFHATVGDNLLLGRPDASPDEIMAACDAAGLGKWVRQQPAGLDTVVGEDGGQLSGGQRQRLVLARALLAAPAVLVLDEPTEGLDPAAARQVMASALAAAGSQRAVVVVTHQWDELAAMDEVLVLDGGSVAQRGTHEELVAEQGWYRDQHLSQVMTVAASKE